MAKFLGEEEMEEESGEDVEKWGIEAVGGRSGRQQPAWGELQGHVLSLGAEVFVCRAERYRFPLHVSAFI